MFDPLTFLQVARTLCGGGEARLRTSVSRAYYAAFLYIRQKFALAPGEGSHQAAVAHLYKVRKPAAAKKLHRLRVMRNQSDYDTTCQIGIQEAQQALKLADSVVKLVRQI